MDEFSCVKSHSQIRETWNYIAEVVPTPWSSTRRINNCMCLVKTAKEDLIQQGKRVRVITNDDLSKYVNNVSSDWQKKHTAGFYFAMGKFFPIYPDVDGPLQ